jgi:bifunctional UDP-N-acetylglucosamine pyrophosphorylase / glucosamine-1-phosphate N-acetyltransferase
MSSTAIILAAGKSTRMKSRKPKPLHEICGRPMLEYIIRACFGAGCAKVIVVVGFGKEEIIAQFGHDPRIAFVEQTQQLGTGHAVRVCEEELENVRGDVVILAGDVPLIRAQVLRTLLQAHHDDRADASMATAIVDDPTGYGRVIRDQGGEFVAIREEVDCTPEERLIREVFPSCYCVKVDHLTWALQQLRNNNRKGEYYLTDIYQHLRDAGRRILALQAVTQEDVMAPNSRQELALADAVMQERIQRQHREAGVSIYSPDNVYIEDGAVIGLDTMIRPFTFIGRDASIGTDCTIGPFAVVPRESIVPDGSSIAGSVDVDAMPKP